MKEKKLKMTEQEPELTSIESELEMSNGDNDDRLKEKSLSTNHFEASMFTGPIPPPKILAQYNNVLPNAADRIIAMAEKEQEHRHKMQSQLVDAQILDLRQDRMERRLGQIFGLTIGIVSIISGSITAIAGSPIAGGLIGSAGVAGLVSVFIYKRKEQEQELSQLRRLEMEQEDLEEEN